MCIQPPAPLGVLISGFLSLAWKMAHRSPTYSTRCHTLSWDTAGGTRHFSALPAARKQEGPRVSAVIHWRWNQPTGLYLTIPQKHRTRCWPVISSYGVNAPLFVVIRKGLSIIGSLNATYAGLLVLEDEGLSRRVSISRAMGDNGPAEGSPCSENSMVEGHLCSLWSLTCSCPQALVSS